MIRTTCIVSVLALAAGSTLADDLTPPTWRFNPGTTVQHWDFSAGPTGGPPDAPPFNNPYGTPIMVPTTGTNWLPAIFGRNDVWDITGGSLQFDIPNTGNSAHMKEIQIQVTYLALAPGVSPGYAVSGPSGMFTQVGGPSIIPLSNGWVHETTLWTIGVCPPFERIALFPGLAGVQFFVDQVVIDTQCIVPTPASASLLALGGVCALRRRR
ncbi:MAG: hypothetical protein KF678_07315 [Phycisphaeraceae bacterium]|nr:hypothetical protein [Phycisphaeraceae bacterium]